MDKDEGVLDVSELPYGKYTLSAEMLADDAVVAGQKKSYTHNPLPDWLGNEYGWNFDTVPAPFTPVEPVAEPNLKQLTMPAKALQMIDGIDIFAPEGGSFKLGFIRGAKTVDPNEWFFKAHFYQDPVCPGSLGIESYLQLMRYAALNRWKMLKNTHTVALATGIRHNWSYRGQVTQKNTRIEVEATVTQIEEKPFPQIQSDGFLKVDGLYIYKMKGFGVRLVPLDR